MGQLVHQGQAWRVGQQAVQVHLGQRHAPVLQASLGLLRQAGEHRLGLAAAVGLHHAHAQVDALAPLRLGGLEHGVGLAHAGRGTEEDFQAATPFAGQFGQQRIRAAGITHSGISFSLRLRARTLTTGSPMAGRSV